MTPDVSDTHSCGSRPFIVPGELLVHNFLFLRNFLLIWPSNLFLSLWRDGEEERHREETLKASRGSSRACQRIRGRKCWWMDADCLSRYSFFQHFRKFLVINQTHFLKCSYVTYKWTEMRTFVLLRRPPSVSYWGKCGSIVRHAGSF